MKVWIAMIGLASAGLWMSTAAAEGPAPAAGCGTAHCCADCGKHCPCAAKTCQVVCEIKKEKKHCWCVETKEFCPLLPGCGRCRECGDGGGSCEHCRDGACGDGGPAPRCGKMRTVKTLVKKEYEVEVPKYKCVVKYLCESCGEGKPAAPTPAQPAPARPLPPPPHGA